MKWLQGWVLALVLVLVTTASAGGLKSELQSAGASEEKYTCYSACPPGSTTTAVRAKDYGSGEYYQATWTVIHDTNTKGQITLFDLSGGSVRDSVVVRLLPTLTYGGDELIGDSVKVLIWDVDDTTYVFGKGTKAVNRNWQGD